MDPEVRSHVFADSIDSGQIVSAVAHGYQTLTYPGETFPVLVSHAGGQAQGEVLLNPNAEALERMTFYEGDEYGMGSLEVVVADGSTLIAHYNQASSEELPLTAPWCFDHWQRHERETFVEMCRQYMQRCWGKMSIHDADAVWQELQSLRT